MKTNLRVYLADDHNLFRKAMAALLRTFDRVGIVEEAGNGKELLKLCESVPPEVAIVDLQMPVMDGLAACDNLIARWPGTKIIVLSMHDEMRYVRHMLELGVHGFLLKDVSVDELQRALYAVVDHDFYRNEVVVRARKSLPTEDTDGEEGASATILSRRERQILRLIYDEFTIREISQQLSISQNTVRNHRVNLMKKAGVNNLVGLIKYAYAAGVAMEGEG